MREIKEYHDNGQMREHYWRNEKGQLDGEYKNWSYDGQSIERGFYKNGLMIGEYENRYMHEHYFWYNNEEVDITNYITDVNNITEQEYFHLQLVFDGYFPILKFDGIL